MNSLQVTKSVLFLVLIIHCEGKAEIGDYIVDCSACNYLPLKGVDSYQCNVRCEAQGEASVNVTTLYDIVSKLSDRLDDVTRELEEAKRKLSMEVSFNVEMTNFVTYNDGDKVIFDNVTSNGGNAYDNVTGISTVPHNGSYELTLRNMGNPRGIYTDIVRNNARLCRAHGSGTNDQGTCTVRQKLVAGDQIWGRNALNTYRYNRFYNSLTGHLIHLD